MVGRRKSTWPGRFCYRTCTKGNWKYIDLIFLALGIKTKCISPTRGYFLIKTCVSITSNTASKIKFSIKTALVNFIKFPENTNLLTFTKEVLIEKLSTFGVYWRLEPNFAVSFSNKQAWKLFNYFQRRYILDVGQSSEYVSVLWFKLTGFSLVKSTKLISDWFDASLWV